MNKTPLNKTPLNEAVGKFLAIRRQIKGLSVENTAQALGISHAYLRAIESGSRALPSYTIRGLVCYLGIQFDIASELLSLVSYLDVRKKNQSIFYDVEEIIVRLELFKDIETQLDKILLLVRHAIDDFENGKHQEYSERIVLIVDEFRGLIEGSGAKHKPSESSDQPHLDWYRMSPVFEDIVDALASRLALFPPHISPTGFLNWEKHNSNRIINLYGYMSDPDGLLIAANQFDWTFLWNQFSPNVRIILSRNSNISIDYINEEFIRRLQNKLREKSSGNDIENLRGIKNIKRRVFLRYANSIQDKCDEGLFFDFVTRGMPSQLDSKETRQKYIDLMRYRKFSNAWIYQIKFESIRADDNRSHLIGFLDTYQKDISSAYAVAMNSNHVMYWKSVFDEENK